MRLLFLHLLLFSLGATALANEVLPEKMTNSAKVIFSKKGFAKISDGDANLVFHIDLKNRMLSAIPAVHDKVYVTEAASWRGVKDRFSYLMYHLVNTRRYKAQVDLTHHLDTYGILFNTSVVGHSKATLKPAASNKIVRPADGFSEEEVEKILDSEDTLRASCDSGWDEVTEHIAELETESLKEQIKDAKERRDTFIGNVHLNGLESLLFYLERVNEMFDSLKSGAFGTSLVDFSKLPQCVAHLRAKIRAINVQAELVQGVYELENRAISYRAREGKISIVLHLTYLHSHRKYELLKPHPTAVVTPFGIFGLKMPDEMLAISTQSDKTFFSISEEEYNRCDPMQGVKVCNGNRLKFLQGYSNLQPGETRCSYSIYNQHDDDAWTTCRVEMKTEEQQALLIGGDSVAFASKSQDLMSDCGLGKTGRIEETNGHHVINPGCSVQIDNILIDARDNFADEKDDLIVREYPTKILEVLEKTDKSLATAIRVFEPANLAEMDYSQYHDEKESTFMHDLFLLFLVLNIAFVPLIILVGCCGAAYYFYSNRFNFSTPKTVLNTDEVNLSSNV